MELRELLNLCQGIHSDDWIRLPGERPATAMVAGLVDPGFEDARTRPLSGHSIAIYEPDARLSMVWPVPDEPEAERPRPTERFLPEWAEKDNHGWKSARSAFAVILFNGVPIWQELVWYLDWGAGIGGYVGDIQPVFGEEAEDGVPPIEKWTATSWSVGLAQLINSFSAYADWYSHDPTPRLVPSPSSTHPIDAARSGG